MLSWSRTDAAMAMLSVFTAVFFGPPTNEPAPASALRRQTEITLAWSLVAHLAELLGQQSAMTNRTPKSKPPLRHGSRLACSICCNHRSVPRHTASDVNQRIQHQNRGECPV